jgi:hypothetical protein
MLLIGTSLSAAGNFWCCWRALQTRQCFHTYRASRRGPLRRYFEVEILQIASTWMNFGGKQILPREQGVNFCRSFDRRVENQDALPLFVLLDMRSGDPVSASFLLYLLNEVKGIVSLVIAGHAHLYLL